MKTVLGILFSGVFVGWIGLKIAVATGWFLLQFVGEFLTRLRG